MSIIYSIFAADFDKGDIYGFQNVHVCHSYFGIFSERCCQTLSFSLTMARYPLET